METVQWRGILFVFYGNVSLVLYPESFYFLKIFLWASWMWHIYGHTLSFFKAVLRIFADVSVWPRCLIASRWKLCSEGEIVFVFSVNVSLVLYPQSFYLLKIFLWTIKKRHNYGYTLSVFKESWGFLPMFRFDLDVWSHLDWHFAVKAKLYLFSLRM